MRSAAILMLCLGLMQAYVASARETILLAHPYPRETNYAPRVLTLICTDAFDQLGKDVDVRLYPPLRGALEAGAGKIDGEVGRAYAYGDNHPNLIRVGEALLSFRVTAFTRIPGLKISGWDSLKGTSYRVQYRSGYTTFKTQLEQILPARQISSVVDSQLGLQNVALGRTDIFVDLEEFGELQLARLQNRYGDVYNAGLVQDTPVYIYLHKRHAALVPRLAEIVARMKSSGAINRYISQALGEERGAAP
ncbi:substrate-binding periplasmic protein [Duganella rhizosphaerae]|uniref:substrate-binding periplasmic protein n=1 Tax=Duganella rhizosphaerae TaxID=2885763 RepID=UPI00403F735B